MNIHLIMIGEVRIMNNKEFIKELKVVPISDIILLTGMEYTLVFKGEEFIKLLPDAGSNAIGLAMKQRGKSSISDEKDFYKVGVLLKIQEIKYQEQSALMTVQTLERIGVIGLHVDEQSIVAEYEIAEDIIDLDTQSQEDMLKYIKKVVHEIGANFRGSEPFIKTIDNENNLNVLMCKLGQYMHISGIEKQGFIETRSLKERSLKFLDHLIKHKESIKLQFEVAEKFSEKANKLQRETVLREHLKAIQEELNEGKGGSDNPGNSYREKIEAAGMPDEVKKTVLEEVAKFESQNPSSPDYNIIRNYLDILVDLPWRTSEPKEIRPG